MWKDLTKEWQAAFEEAWAAFRSGSTPIGAVLTDEGGDIILRDHNRSGEKDTLNRRISHAEANLLKRLDTLKYDPKKLTLYTTMEPCPMCMGTAIMSGIRHLRSAAYDPYCGMVHLLDTEPYYRSKQAEYLFDCEEKELVQTAMQGFYELRHIEKGAGAYVFECFEKHLPQAAAAAKKLYEKKELDRLAEREAPFSEVYDIILSYFHNGQ